MVTDRLTQGDWPEHRMLVMTKLDELGRGQNEILHKIEQMSSNYDIMRLEITRELTKEVTANATRRSFIASLIPMLLSLLALLANAWMTLKGFSAGGMEK